MASKKKLIAEAKALGADTDGLSAGQLQDVIAAMSEPASVGEVADTDVPPPPSAPAPVPALAIVPAPKPAVASGGRYRTISAVYIGGKHYPPNTEVNATDEEVAPLLGHSVEAI